MYRPSLLPLSGTEKKMGGGSKGGTVCTGRYKGVRALRPESVAGGEWFEVLWNFECPVGLSQNINNMCLFQMKEILAQFGRSAKKLICGAT